MDIVMITNTLRAGTDLKLIGTYTVCTFFFLILLLFKQKFEWDKKRDTPIACVAFVLICTSCITEATIGVFAGAAALFIAGVPNMIKTLQIKNPPMRMIFVGLSFFLGPFMSCINFYQSNAQLEEYVYPILSSTYWSIILVNLFLKQRALLR